MKEQKAKCIDKIVTVIIKESRYRILDHFDESQCSLNLGPFYQPFPHINIIPFMSISRARFSFYNENSELGIMFLLRNPIGWQVN